MPFPLYQGNCPKSVRKAAKYKIRSHQGNYVVAITYEVNRSERWYPSTDKHPSLVKMVNDVKSEYAGNPGGNFYINEFHQVIVPVANGNGNYYLAGEYPQPLRFEFEDKIISGEAFDLEQRLLSPGSDWVGPHAGIPYTLAAGGNDIYFKYSPRPNVENRCYLSEAVGKENAKAIASPIKAIKGHMGGVFYVNEFKSIFMPVQEDGVYRYAFAGQLDMGLWFPKVGS